ncbi:helix-turn-helix transcriptional regulator [Paenibacillus larvae]|uniref:helix-turn-helix transcriptional regulator n=1 Tax=Paenibacillus larvae TaxID=1464 RepID=UPI00227FBAD2|nr:helix-turn-helix transcriptional regulator [Paenibacillus larvae]MCY9509071.1 helix-turn-helix transcriptional regulator [Paenibacillus larvae]MCY9526158.1 helix-turn-helix transcriptional regulator [Paenibacillus larvae]
MTEPVSYTTEEVAKRLKVSKLTVYDLMKKGKLPSYRVGRQVRVDAEDLNRYIQSTKTGLPKGRTGISSGDALQPAGTSQKGMAPIIISGQDMSLDLLAKQLESRSNLSFLRAYNGSLTSLMELFYGKAGIVSLHLFDGDTGEYNLPYAKRILTGHSFQVIHLLRRNAGFYVQKGNPLQIHTWEDLKRKDVRIMNRERGSGARVLLDEQLRLQRIYPSGVTGYDQEMTNHIGVATSVSIDKADVGIGIERIASLIPVDFIPLISEQYDLVIPKTPQTEHLLASVQEVLSSQSFKDELRALGGYDLSETGTILYDW